MERCGPLGANTAPHVVDGATQPPPEESDPIVSAFGLAHGIQARPARGGGESRHMWWSFSRRGRRRLLVPVQLPSRLAASELLNGPLMVAGMRVALSLADFLGFPRAVAASTPTIPFDALLAPLFPHSRLRYAVYCGTPSVFEKYTIQCIDGTGRAVAYVKLSRGPEAPAAILNEARVLETLARLPEFVDSIPSVLKVTEAWGSSISILGAPAGPSRRVPSFPPQSVARFAQALFDSDTHHETWVRSPVRRTILEACASLERSGEGRAAELLHRAVAVLDADFGKSLIPHGRAHGDFVPWNVRLAPGPYVFDWEWSRASLPFYDLLHFFCFPAIQRGGRGLGARETRAIPKLQALKGVLEAHAPAGLPFPADDERWPRAYLAQAYAFYARAADAGGTSPETHPLLRELHARLSQTLRPG